MSSCVLDASCVFPWLFADEGSAGADTILTLVGQQGALVPALRYVEVTNGLGMAERRNQLTAYDATYLELAIRHTLPLATKDKALRTAARSAGVQLLDV